MYAYLQVSSYCSYTYLHANMQVGLSGYTYMHAYLQVSSYTYIDAYVQVSSYSYMHAHKWVPYGNMGPTWARRGHVERVMHPIPTLLTLNLLPARQEIKRCTISCKIKQFKP